MPRVLLINALSLLGSEIRQALEGRRDLWEEVRLATTDPERVGTLTEVAGAAALVESFDPAGGTPWDLVVVCDEPFPDAAELRRLGPSTTVLFARTGPGGEGALPIVAGVNTDRARTGLRLWSPPAPVVLLHRVPGVRGVAHAATVARGSDGTGVSRGTARRRCRRPGGPRRASGPDPQPAHLQ